MQRYLAASTYIDFDTPEVLSTARRLAEGAVSEADVARACFEFVRDAIRHSGVAPNDLEMEITETVLIGNQNEAEKMLMSLKQTGLRIVLDDFGTGYSSLGYLSRFEIDKIKIDAQFVKSLADGERQRQVVAAMIDLAQRLNIDVVAEGVEAVAVQSLGIIEGHPELGAEYLGAQPLRGAQLLLMAHQAGFQPRLVARRRRRLHQDCRIDLDVPRHHLHRRRPHCICHEDRMARRCVGGVKES